MSAHSIRRLLRIFKIGKGLVDAGTYARNNGHGDPEAAYNASLCRSCSVADVAREREKKNTIHNAQVGDHLARYRNYVMRIGNGNVCLADANGWLASHLKSPSLEEANSHMARHLESRP